VAGLTLRRIAEGDKAAVQECIDLYGGLVWSLARRLSPTREDAEDAVQEIFIDIWKSAARFDQAQASETTFIAMIARRRLIDRLRRFERTPEAEALSPEIVDATRQDKQIELNSEAALAARAMRQLRPEQQKVLQLAIYQGLSHQEIANATGMPLGTVKTHARRGLLHIREALGIRSS
jgi:RNA polymerase sigma-70 factor (ECF subfamily)